MVVDASNSGQDVATLVANEQACLRRLLSSLLFDAWVKPPATLDCSAADVYPSTHWSMERTLSAGLDPEVDIAAPLLT